MIFNQENKIVWLLVTTIIFVLGSFGFMFFGKAPTITASSPENGATNVEITTSSIGLSFNYKQNDILKDNIFTEPKIFGEWSKSTNGKDLELAISTPLEPLTNYKITANMKNRYGKNISKSILFTTKYVTDDNIPAELKAIRDSETDFCEENPDAKTCPTLLDRTLPYADPDGNFTMNFSEKYGEYIITLMSENENSNKKAKEDAFLWIKNLGVDPDKLKIDYITLEPSTDE